MKKIYTAIVLMLMLPIVAFATDDQTLLRVEFLNQRPDPVEPGSFVELRWRVNNLGGESKNFVFEIVPSDTFRISEGERQIERTIGGFASSNNAATIFYRVAVDQGATEGDNKIRLRYYSKDQPHVVREIEQTVRIESQQGLVQIANVQVDPAKIKIGETFEVSLDVNNLGTQFLNNVQLRLITDNTGFVPIGSSNQKVIRQIPGQGEGSFSFTFLADSSTQVRAYTIPAILTYTDNLGRAYEQSTNIGLSIDGTPKYLTNIERSEIITSGSSGEIVVSVSNIGKGNMNFVVLELMDTQDYTVLTPRSSAKDYLGNLESDDFQTSQYQIHVKNTDKEEIPLRFTMYYNDAYNKAYTDQFEIPLRVFTPDQAREVGLISNGGPGFFTYIILLVIVGFGVYWYRKKRRLQEEE
ncbi:MAG: COG1361 S-layer family protein [Candidatus Woesearchaeota archaeon]